MRKILFISGISVLISCGSNKCRICGKWTSIDIVDNSGLNIRDEMILNEDGTIVITVYSNGDSILERWEGHFKLLDSEKILRVQYKDTITFDHQIKELKNDTMLIETEGGPKFRMVRK